MSCIANCMVSCNNATEEKKEITAIKEMGPQAVDAPGVAKLDEESTIRRCPSSKDLDAEGMKKKYYGGEHGTLANYLKAQVAKFKDNDAMKWRPIDKFEKGEIEEKGKKKPWEFIHLKETQSKTFAQMWEDMVAFGNGLREIGIQGERVGLYEETRQEWMTSCYGLWTQGLTGVTVYANLGEDALEYAIKEAELSTVICNAKGVKTLQKICKDAGIPLPMLIYTDTLPADNTVEDNIYSWEEVLEKGRGKPEPELPKDVDATALIMYTSGTTGDPKGVVISHGNIVAAVIGLQERLAAFLGLERKADEEETYVAYLPLAHILEFSAENVMLLRGATVCYGNPRTLTNTSAKPHGDLQEFKPVFFAGVPRIFDTIKKAVEGKIADRGATAAKVVSTAMEQKIKALKEGKDTPKFNEKFFANTRELLGGRVKAIVSGGAPLSAKTQEFLLCAFCCYVGQGYGLTETCACGTIQRYYDIQTENIGGPLPNCEFKLKDAGEWKHTDEPQPRGEICIRGPAVTQGYYKQPEKTEEAFMKDGWFHTGDVGTFCPDGTIKIVGRVKALAKNALGEYVALDALESTYVLNDLAMPNGVCVLVDGEKSYIAALVLTDEAKAMKFAAANKIAGEWPAILEKEEFHTKAAESLAATAKANGKKPFECVKKVRVLNEEWTPENGVLTAAMKLKRRVVDVQYKDLIAELFKE